MTQAVRNPFRKLGMIAGILGMLQGAVWFILAVIGIVEHFISIGYMSPSYANFLWAALHQTVLYKSYVFLITGRLLFIILCVYAVISVIWLIISMLLLIYLRRPQSSKCKTMYASWGCLTLLTCLFDGAVTIVLVCTYIQAAYKATFFFPYNAMAYGILFSVAARGYVLWIVNFVLAIMTLKARRNFIQHKSVLMSHQVAEFDNRRNYGQGGHVNQGWENDTPNFSRPYIYPPQALPQPSDLAQNPSHSRGPPVFPKPQYVDNMRFDAQTPSNYPKYVAPRPKLNYIYPSGEGAPNSSSGNNSSKSPPVYNRNLNLLY